MKVKVKVISHLILKDDAKNISIICDFLIEIQMYDQIYKFYYFNLKNPRPQAFLHRFHHE